jgi:tripartite-type tricarboxylate transporter receptor subunit TctC
MKLPHRRQFLHMAASAASLPALSRIARAQTYPTRAVRMIVPFPPGGALDIAARLVGQRLSERLGQTFFVDNRPGANGSIGAQAAANATPDGYTLLVVGGPHAVNVALYGKLAVDLQRDIVPIATILRTSFAMVVPLSLPAKTVPEFIAYAKANPGKLNMASAGNGNTEHVAGELFKMMTGISMLHVPYRGTAPALTDMLAGQTQVHFAAFSAAVEHIRAGTLRALAVTTAARLPALPDVPTVGEFVPGYEATSFVGVGAPHNTAGDVIDGLNREIDTAITDPKLIARITDLGGTTSPGSPADFGKLIADETEKWAKVIKFAGIKAD